MIEIIFDVFLLLLFGLCVCVCVTRRFVPVSTLSKMF